ncbi:MAG TPA: NTF2-like N-terminal transpeptidase domain-containing protein [Ktedonobacterales bacterium]|nr:NTF2-like N-terminal transpeptidase domain-containing protein [Ktedonobacterales bacterium]
MADPQRHQELAARIEEKRRLLEGRADVSQRLRELSSSSSRNLVAPARKRRSPLLTLLVTGGAVVALFACIVASVALIGSGIWVQAQLGSPNTTVEDFFSAIHAQNYPQAYGFLSHKAQSELSEERFQQVYQASDTLAGAVDYYAIMATVTQGSTATVTVDVVRQGDARTAQVFALALAQEGGSWRITAIQQTGTAPAPTPAS